MRWYKKLASLDSPVLAGIFKPIFFNRLLAEELKTPKVSTAIIIVVVIIIIIIIIIYYYDDDDDDDDDEDDNVRNDYDGS